MQIEHQRSSLSIQRYWISCAQIIAYIQDVASSKQNNRGETSIKTVAGPRSNFRDSHISRLYQLFQQSHSLLTQAIGIAQGHQQLPV
jgi:hypothetical protein